MPMYDMKCTKCGRLRSDVRELPPLTRGQRKVLDPKCRCGNKTFMRATPIHKTGYTPAHWAEQCGSGDGRLLKG